MYEMKTVKSKEELLTLFTEKGYKLETRCAKEDSGYVLFSDTIEVCFFVSMFHSCGKTIKMRKLTDADKQKWINDGAEMMSYDFVTLSHNYYINDWLK